MVGSFVFSHHKSACKQIMHHEQSSLLMKTFQCWDPCFQTFLKKNSSLIFLEREEGRETSPLTWNQTGNPLMPGMTPMRLSHTSQAHAFQPFKELAEVCRASDKPSLCICLRFSLSPAVSSPCSLLGHALLLQTQQPLTGPLLGSQGRGLLRSFSSTLRPTCSPAHPHPCFLQPLCYEVRMATSLGDRNFSAPL